MLVSTRAWAGFMATAICIVPFITTHTPKGFSLRVIVLINRFSAFAFIRQPEHPCERMPFDLTIDEDFIFKFSLALLSFLSLLWMFILAVILWLRKIQHRVATEVAKAENFEPRSLYQHINNAFVYSAGDVNEDGTHLRETTFHYSAEQEDQIWTNSSNTVPSEEGTVNNDYTTNCSSSRQTEEGGNGTGSQRKIYKSLKSPTNINYAMLYGTPKEAACLPDTGDVTHRNKKICKKNEAVNEPQSTSKQTDITNKKPNGTAPKIVENNNLNHTLDGDAPQNDYENEYLAVIHSEATPELSANTKATIPPHSLVDDDAQQHDYENEYLAVIHSEETPELSANTKATIPPHSLVDGDAQQNDYENEYLAVIHSEESPTSSQSTKNTIPCHVDESDYLAPIETAPVEKRQQKQKPDSEIHSERNPKASGVLDRDEGVMSIQKVKRLAEDQLQAKDIAKCRNVEEDDYDYIATRAGKEWTVSPGNPSKPQVHNQNGSQEAQYINKDSTVQGRELKENATSPNEYDDGYLTIIPNNEFEAHAKDTGEEAKSAAKDDHKNATEQFYENIRG